MALALLLQLNPLHFGDDLRSYFLDVLAGEGLGRLPGDLLKLIAEVDGGGDPFLVELVEVGAGAGGLCDVFVHLLDPASLAPVPDLEVDSQILLEHVPELLLQVEVVGGESLVLLFHVLPPPPGVAQLIEKVLVFSLQLFYSSLELLVFCLQPLELLLVGHPH